MPIRKWTKGSLDEVRPPEPTPAEEPEEADPDDGAEEPAQEGRD